MAFLLCWKNIARCKPQQGDRCRRRAALALPTVRARPPRQSKIWWSARSVSKNYARLATLQKSGIEVAFPCCGAEFGKLDAMALRDYV